MNKKWLAAVSLALLIPAAALAQGNSGSHTSGPPSNPGNGNGNGPGNGSGVANESLAANPRIEADETALSDAYKKLSADVKAGNTAAYAADSAAILRALAKLQADRKALDAAIAKNAAVNAAKAVVDSDVATLETEHAQLRIDEIIGSKVAIAADEQA